MSGAVAFHRENGSLFADSALWVKGETIILSGNVLILDSVYQLSADRVNYDIQNQLAHAKGKIVKIISLADSLMALGTNAYYSRDSSFFRMADRPTVFLNFQDTTRLVRIDADRISYSGNDKIGYADGNVIINQSQTESHSGRAIIYIEDNILALDDNPSARRKESEIKGDTMIIYSEKSELKKILVDGNAIGYFNESSHKDPSVFDISELKAKQMEFNLDSGKLNNITASGQAFSYYSPGTKDSIEIVKNNVSGDTIKLTIENETLTMVDVIGGAEGEYMTGKFNGNDSGRIYVEDTVSYCSDLIGYTISDSAIVLTNNAQVINKNMALKASKIKYNTSRGLVTAFDDTLRVDSSITYIPVVLKDGTEELVGSYLEYSMKTERGLIRQSKSAYQEGYYRGGELFREEKDVFYVDEGLYTSCDLDEPHFHFHSSRMKMLQGDKIIARPVIFYIDRVPLLIVPYYVFSIKPGRHSGFLPFKIGNFERGASSISNVGYYWAASEYADLMASIDYYESYGLNYNAALRYNLRYNFSGSISGSYRSETTYPNYREMKTKRWQLRANHSHTISPTFSIRADGTFISDKNYYSDFSTNLDERLNRDIKSQISMSKQWKGASLCVQVSHVVNLDKESRTDELPTASLSIPGRSLFGSQSKKPGEEYKQKWYQTLYVSYSSNLRNYSSRTTDTSGFRSRKEFAVINHNPSIRISPISLLKYFRFGPSFSYQETWYKIFKTDQSDKAGIDAAETYRRYSYSSSASLSTDVYGTVHPNLWGLEGLRHVITPSISFHYAPEITRHNNIKSYTGAGGGGSKQKTLSFSLSQLFQAKVKSGETSKNLDLLSIGSSVGYNFEATDRKFSDLATSAQTSLLKNIRMSVSMSHDLYEPNTDKLKLWSPSLSRFSISTSFSTGGIFSEYGDMDTSAVLGKKGQQFKEKQKWSFSLSHYYSESGRDSSFYKTHSANLTLKLNLTPNMRLTYWQTYDFSRHRTISRRIEIERDLHCWKGYFYWIPDGSNKGYYFRLNVISIPEVKFEKSESGVRGAFF
jgi:lipopolysaccharide assembly outer membrane protein LptD (OstA)